MYYILDALQVTQAVVLKALNGTHSTNGNQQKSPLNFVLS